MVGAFLVWNFQESAIVTFLFLFGAFLEQRTLNKTRSAIKKLTQMAPESALKQMESGEFEESDHSPAKAMVEHIGETVLYPVGKTDVIKGGGVVAQVDGHRVVVGNGIVVVIETSDVVLMNSDFSGLPHALGLTKATAGNMVQNIVIAVGVVLALLTSPILSEWMNMAIGMFVHEASILVVIFNGIRLLRYKLRK